MNTAAQPAAQDGVGGRDRTHPGSENRVPFTPLTFSMGPPLVDLTQATRLAAELEDLELAARYGLPCSLP